MTEWENKQLAGKIRDNCRSIISVTGMTTNIATEVIDLDTRQNHDTVFTISNTGDNSLYYSIKVRNEYTDNADFVVFLNEVASGGADEVILARHARVFVDIQSHVLNSHTTYSINAIGGT